MIPYIHRLKVCISISVIVFVCIIGCSRTVLAFPPNNLIPVDPQNGGRSINPEVLKSGDIIVTSTKNLLSPIIRQLSGSEVSHAILYIGNRQVIEAIGEGVVLRKLDDSLACVNLAVAFRHPAITDIQADNIRDFALGKVTYKFNKWGLVLHPRFGLGSIFCNSESTAEIASCQKWIGTIVLDLTGKDQFFCSQLVNLAYNSANLPIANWSAELSSPGDVPTLGLIGDLQYVGHLKYIPLPDTISPTASISSPITGATANGNIDVTASASDNICVSKVEFYLDSAATPAATKTSSPYIFSWDSTSVANGTHTIKAMAYDAANNIGQSATVSITVNNTSTLPVGTVARNECSNPPAGTVFCEDFEGTNPKSHFDDYDGNPDTENLVVTDSGPSGDSSNKEIRLRVPAGVSGVSDLIKVLPGSYDKLYTRWYFKYEPGFNFAAKNHGGGLAAGDRNLIVQSGIRPTGADWAGFFVQYQENTANPFTYSYYRGMYQECIDPNGSCWGDSFPCVFDNGASSCTKPQDRPTVTLPNLVAGHWYCYEQMVDMGTASTDGSGATGRLTQWLDNNTFADNSNLWLRTTANLKIQNLWLSLYHHDGTHSTVGELIDNVVVSTQRIGCGGSTPSQPTLSMKLLLHPLGREKKEGSP